MTLRIISLSIMTLSIMTLSKMMPSIMTLCIMMLSIMMLSIMTLFLSVCLSGHVIILVNHYDNIPIHQYIKSYLSDRHL